MIAGEKFIVVWQADGQEWESPPLDLDTAKAMAWRAADQCQWVKVFPQRGLSIGDACP